MSTFSNRNKKVYEGISENLGIHSKMFGKTVDETDDVLVLWLRNISLIYYQIVDYYVPELSENTEVLMSWDILRGLSNFISLILTIEEASFKLEKETEQRISSLCLLGGGEMFQNDLNKYGELDQNILTPRMHFFISFYLIFKLDDQIVEKVMSYVFEESNNENQDASEWISNSMKFKLDLLNFMNFLNKTLETRADLFKEYYNT